MAIYATFVPAGGLAETLLVGVVTMTAINWFYLKRLMRKMTRIR